MSYYSIQHIMNPTKQYRQMLLNSLHEYFYYHQYEERFAHFRACDQDFDYDFDGTKHYYYIFYED